MKFQDKDFPEKQEINVVIATNKTNSNYLKGKIERSLVFAPLRKGIISIEIDHTARTWGNDIESLLTGYIENLMKPPSRLKQIVYENNHWIAFVTGGFLFVSSIVGAYFATQKFLISQMDALQALQSSLDREEFINITIASGLWGRFFLYILFFLIIAFLISIISGIAIGMYADNEETSFLLLSKQAERRRKEVIGKYKNTWKVFISLAVWNLILGIVGNILFALFFQNLLK